MHTSRLASLLLAAALPAVAPAQPATELPSLRREIDALRAEYEARLRALELRLQAAEARAAAAPPGAASAPTAVSGAAAAAAAPTATTATLGQAPTTPVRSTAPDANALNPALTLILSGAYRRTSRDPSDATIAGFQLPVGAEIGPGERGFSLAESELGVSATIDPWWRGAAHLALHPDDAVSVEEAYVQTTALGGGVSLKLGRFLSNVGYLNPQHAHTWDFADNPLAYQALLGTQLGDDGVQLSWVAPLERYLEVGAELGRGRSFPGGDLGSNGAGLRSLSLRTGGDVGASQSWRLGVSALSARARDQALSAVDAAGAAVTNAFSGRTRMWIVDAVWKWAPDGNATRTNLKLQGEYLRSKREGALVYDTGNAASAGGYRAEQSGWYLQGVYQFMPRWRVGLRTERLDAGRPDFGVNAAALAGSGLRPSKHTLMLDWSPSEFSRLRAQFARDRSREGGAVDNQVTLQYQMSLGAHGAHGF